jgi:hypothetical protein
VPVLPQDFGVSTIRIDVPAGLIRCRVCGIDLDEDEILHIIKNFKTYFGDVVVVEKRHWEQAIEPPGVEEEY